jgi:hypothetical protein
MLCRNFGGNVAAGDDGNRSADHVSNDCPECHNVYILCVRGRGRQLAMMWMIITEAPTYMSSG